MEVATIVPQNYLYMTRDDDYFMCLAHLVGAPGMAEYTEFFKQRAKAGKFVIMDNGLIEGDPRPISELIEKARIIGASEIVLPDVFRDKNATLAVIEEAIKYIKLNGLGGLSDCGLMLVPQGNTIEEWADCAHELILRYPHIDFTIGVPKVLVDIGGRDGRVAALTELFERCPIAKHKTYHLLGCWQTPLEVTILDKWTRQDNGPYIRGVDSAIAFVYTRAGILLNSDDRPDGKPINFETTKVGSLKLRYNIHLWRKAAGNKKFVWA